MKRYLVAAPDPNDTRRLAEALLGWASTRERPRHRNEGLRVARAHHALEVVALAMERSYDAILVDPTLVGLTQALLLERMRQHAPQQRVPIFLVCPRGRYLGARDMGVRRFGVAGFAEPPHTRARVAALLEAARRSRRLLLIDEDPARGDAIARAATVAGYVVHREPSPAQAVAALPRFGPDVIASTAGGVDPELASVVEQYRTRHPLPVLLYGPLAAPTPEVGGLADSAMPTPLSPREIADRVAALVGPATTGLRVREEEARPPADFAGAPSQTVLHMEAPNLEHTPHESTERLPAPNIHPGRAPRVPCRVAVRMRRGRVSWAAETLNLSHGGALLTGTAPPPGDEPVEVELRIPEHDAPVRARARIVWTAAAGESEINYGVRFTSQPPEDRAVLNDYLQRVAGMVFVPP